MQRRDAVGVGGEQRREKWIGDTRDRLQRRNRVVSHVPVGRQRRQDRHLHRPWIFEQEIRRRGRDKQVVPSRDLHIQTQQDYRDDQRDEGHEEREELEEQHRTKNQRRQPRDQKRHTPPHDGPPVTPGQLFGPT